MIGCDIYCWIIMYYRGYIVWFNVFDIFGVNFLEIFFKIWLYIIGVNSYVVVLIWFRVFVVKFNIMCNFMGNGFNL